MSSPLSSILHWAIDTAKTQVQQAALQAIKSGAMQLTAAIAKNAPNVSDFAIAKINEGINHAVAGVMTQKVKD